LKKRRDSFGESRPYCLARFEGEIEGGAFIDFALCPDFSTMAAENFFYRCQSNAGAGKIAGCMEPLEGLEELVSVSLVESRAVVANKKDRDLALLRTAEFYPGTIGPPRKLPGIAEKILHDNLHQAGIGVHKAFPGDNGFYLPLGLLHGEPLKD
jgi:hypothetical protein